MNARLKLNDSYRNGCILFAALAGWLTGSWLVFLVAAVLLLAWACLTGDIRVAPNWKKQSGSMN